MKNPYLRLAIQAIVYSLFMTSILFVYNNGWVLKKFSATIIVDLFFWLVVGGIFSFFTWRAEGYLSRKNARWLARRKKEVEELEK